VTIPPLSDGSKSRSKASLRVSASWRNVRATVSSRFPNGISSADLREIEDVRDQVQEIGTGAVDRARELDLSPRQVAVGVVAELLPEDQDAVQRRAQLVRHVGQEFRLVLRGERELVGLLLERAAGLLDLFVLALDLGVLLGQLLRLLRELLVLLLELRGELLGLFQQPLGLHRRLDAVQDDAGRSGQLVEKRQVRLGERAEGSELDRGLHVAFEEHRKDDDVPWRGLEEAGTDPRGGGRHVGEEDLRPLGRALTD